MYGDSGAKYEKVLKESYDHIDYQTFASAPFRFLHTKQMSRYLFYQDIYHKILNKQGEIHLIGAANGNTLFILAHLAEILEPLNICRRIVAFDTFETNNSTYYPISEIDTSYYEKNPMPHCTSFSKLSEQVHHFNMNTRIHPESRIVLIPGNAADTYPAYCNSNHPLVSMLLLHVELYLVEKAILDRAWSNMPKGSLVVSSSLGYHRSPAVAKYLSEVLELENLNIRRTPYASKMCYFSK